MNQIRAELGTPTSPAVAIDALTIVAALNAFLDSGVMELLERLGPITAYDLACRAHLQGQMVGRTLEALEAAGVVARDGRPDDKWTLVGSTEAWQVLSSSHAGFKADLEAGGQAETVERAVDANSYRAIASLLAEMTRSVAADWARLLALPGLSLLEIGAGNAPWTRALLDVEPTIQPTVLDLEPIVDPQRLALASDYPASTLTFVGGDVFDAGFDVCFDIIVVSAFCRLHAEQQNHELFKRIAGWLAPEGRLIVLDAIDTDSARRHGLGIYALSLAMRSSEGRIYAVADFERWLADAGFAPPTLHETRLGTHSILDCHSSARSLRVT